MANKGLRKYQKTHPYSIGAYRRQEKRQRRYIDKVRRNRSEAAKKGWRTRRYRQHIDRIQHEDMVRNVLGTQMSDKAQLFSFTLFAFTGFELDEHQLGKLEQKFMKLIGEWLAYHYRKNYGFGDYWGTEIERREINVPIAYDAEDFGNWFFEVNAIQQRTGEMTFV